MKSPFTKEEVNKSYKKMSLLFHADRYEAMKQTLSTKYNIQTAQQANERWNLICQAKEELLK